MQTTTVFFFFSPPALFVRDPPFLEGLSHYILLPVDLDPPLVDHAGHHSSARPHQPPSQTLCELRQPRPHCSGVISSLMRPERSLGAFNAEVTVSPWIIPTPYTHGYSIVLVLLLGALWEAAFVSVLFFPPGIWDAESRIVLGNVSRLFGLSLFVRHFSFLGVGLGLSIKWAGVVKFFGPIISFKFEVWEFFFFLCDKDKSLNLRDKRVWSNSGVHYF